MEHNEEKWLPVFGWEGIYEVSNLGRVKSLARTVNGGHNNLKPIPENIMKFDVATGYFRVMLSKGVIRKREFVHRLVARVFVANPYNKPQVNHKDFNRTNNIPDNLEWTSQKENIQHAYRAGRMKHTANTSYKKGSIPFNRKKVLDTSTGIVYQSATEAAKAIGKDRCTLTMCLNGYRPNKTTLIYA